MTSEEVNHCCSLTLIVTGDTLPGDVVAAIGLSPDHSWRKGEQKSLRLPDGGLKVFDSIHEKSGWKFFLPERMKNVEHQEHIRYWLDFVSEHEAQLQRLRENGANITLDAFICTLETANIAPSELLMLGRCGVELVWTFHC